jgi:hypothetical protein
LQAKNQVENIPEEMVHLSKLVPLINLSSNSVIVIKPGLD